MKLKITPFLILAVVSLIYGIYLLFVGVEWDLFIAIFFIITSPVLFLIDIGLKKGFKTYWKLIVFELAVILSLYTIGNYQNNRSQILELPPEFDKTYITIIYGVQNGKDLGISAFTISKTLNIPETGIIITSSEFDENLPRTKIRLSNGIYLNSDQTNKEFVEMLENEFMTDSNLYKFRTWKIQDENCCFFTKNEIKQHKTDLKLLVEK